MTIALLSLSLSLLSLSMRLSSQRNFNVNLPLLVTRVVILLTDCLWLRSRGADKGQNALIQAVRNHHPKCVELLLVR